MQRDRQLSRDRCEYPNDELSVSDFFVGLVRDNMSVLADAARGPLSARDCERQSRALENIGQAAEAMGYPVVKAALDGVEAELAGMGKRLSPQRRARIAEKLHPARSLVRDMVCLAETGAI